MKLYLVSKNIMVIDTKIKGDTLFLGESKNVSKERMMAMLKEKELHTKIAFQSIGDAKKYIKAEELNRFCNLGNGKVHLLSAPIIYVIDFEEEYFELYLQKIKLNYKYNNDTTEIDVYNLNNNLHHFNGVIDSKVSSIFFAGKQYEINATTRDVHISTRAQFRKAYTTQYKNEFFKNPFSIMKQLLKYDDLDPIKMSFVYEYADYNPESRSAGLVKRLGK